MWRPRASADLFVVHLGTVSLKVDGEMSLPYKSRLLLNVSVTVQQHIRNFPTLICLTMSQARCPNAYNKTCSPDSDPVN